MPSLSDNETFNRFAEHLRTVHFTLVTVCFALLAAYLMADRGGIIDAIADLESIIGASKRWEASSNWIDQYASTTKLNDLVDAIEIRVNADAFDDQTGAYCSEHSVLRSWTLKDSDTAALEGREIHDRLNSRTSALDVPAPQSIAAFREIWNRMLNPLKVYVPGVEPVYRWRVDDTGPQEAIRLPGKCHDGLASSIRKSRTLSLIPFSHISMGLDSKRICQELGITKCTHAFVERGIGGGKNEPITTIVIPVSTAISHQVLPQDAFNKTFDTDFEIGLFEQSFSSLSRLTEKYMDLEFDKALGILQAELSRSPAQFEAFGAKVPTDRLVYWGVPLVLVLQAYFFFHLRAFVEKFNSSAMPGTTPWVVLYWKQDTRIVGRLTIVLFPLVVNLWMVVCEVSGTTRGIRAGLMALCLIGSLVCSWKSWFSLNLLWHQQGRNTAEKRLVS